MEPCLKHAEWSFCGQQKTLYYIRSEGQSHETSRNNTDFHQVSSEGSELKNKRTTERSGLTIRLSDPGRSTRTKSDTNIKYYNTFLKVFILFIYYYHYLCRANLGRCCLVSVNLQTPEGASASSRLIFKALISVLLLFNIFKILFL